MTMVRTLMMALALVLLVGDAGFSQQQFRVAFKVDSTPDHLGVKGTVYNDAMVDVYDVYVTVDALDGSGKRVSRGIAFVSGLIPTRGSAAFHATVPVMPTIARFRVQVTSFRLGLAPQSP